jgi:flagellar biosynthetic protein FliR
MFGDRNALLGAAGGFVLVLSRMSGVFVFAPVPGARGMPVIARAMAAGAMAFALWMLRPTYVAATAGELLMMTAGEAILGIGIGLLVAFVEEAFLVGAQTLSLQAGYAFATTIDPSSQADSSVLQVFLSLFSGLLFFSMGFDGQVVRAFAASLESMPPGKVLAAEWGAAIAAAGGHMLSVGLRLAMPVIALLLLIDIALALLGRINAHLQLLAVAFPAKMLAALALLALLAGATPAIYRAAANRSIELMWRLAGR